MITKSPAELRRERDHPAGARGRETRRYVRVDSVGVPRVHRGGDTDALDWRSDAHLVAILARGFKREREARGKDQFRREELDRPARRAGPARQVRFALGASNAPT